MLPLPFPVLLFRVVVWECGLKSGKHWRGTYLPTLLLLVQAPELERGMHITGIREEGMRGGRRKGHEREESEKSGELLATLLCLACSRKNFIKKFCCNKSETHPI